MRSALTIMAAIGLIIPGCTAATPPGPNPSPGSNGFDCTQNLNLSGVVPVEDPIPDRYIVVLKSTVRDTRAVATSIVNEISRTVEVTDVEVFDTTLRGFACSAGGDAAERIATDPRVAFVQQDGRKTVAPLPAQPADATWGLDRIDQRDLPLDGLFEPGSTGASVHVYVIDTGMDIDHAEFTERVGEGFSPAGDGVQDDDGHGSHVAGTIGGSRFGVAKGVVLHPVRVLVNGSGSDSDVIAGIEWVTDHARDNDWPAVANMSLGGALSPALDLATCRSIGAGVSYAVAAGNEGADACDSSPARIVQAIGVGATDRSDRRASFSNTGACVDLFAPGLDITSAGNGGGSTSLSGTSMASPHVTGVAALCLERSPGSTPELVRRCVLEHASRDKLSGIGDGSPNLLLYARDDTAVGSAVFETGSAPFESSLTLQNAAGERTSVFESGQPITMVLTVRNRTESPQTLTLPNAQRYDCTVSNSEGEETWRWSRGRMFAQVLTELTFSPGQSRSFTQVWDQILDDGTVAAPGEYEALGSVPVSLPGTASGPVKLTIRAAADSP